MFLQIRLSWILLLVPCLVLWLGVIYGTRLLLFPHNSSWHAYLLSAMVVLFIDAVFLCHLFKGELRPKHQAPLNGELVHKHQVPQSNRP